MSKVIRTLATLAVAASIATPSHADLVVGLTQGPSALITFDTATPGVTSAPVVVTGLGAGETLVGIDFRPATGQLFGVGSGNTVYTVDRMTGVATLVGPLNSGGATPMPVLLSGTSFGVDFNPTVDRIRIVSNADQNLRVNPNNGATIIDGTLNPGNPNVVGAGYTNSFFGASTTTTLYVLDSSIDDLLIQNPPNSGVLTPVGDLGVDFNDLVGFDIVGGSSAFASLNTGVGATGFYTVNLVTGAATLIGAIGGGSLIADIAIAIQAVPEPATLTLLGLALAGLGFSRRKRAVI